MYFVFKKETLIDFTKEIAESKNMELVDLETFHDWTNLVFCFTDAKTNKKYRVVFDFEIFGVNKIGTFQTILTAKLEEVEVYSVHNPGKIVDDDFSYNF